MLQRTLTVRQKIHYWETGWSYLVSAVCVPVSYGILGYSLISNVYILPASGWYLVLKFFSMVLPVALAWLLSARSMASSRAWAALWPLNLLALGRAMTPWKLSYRVTEKDARRSYWHVVYLWPQSLLLAGTLLCFTLHLHRYGLTMMAAVGAFWIAVACYWILPLLERAIGTASEDHLLVEPPVLNVT